MCLIIALKLFKSLVWFIEFWHIYFWEYDKWNLINDTCYVIYCKSFILVKEWFINFILMFLFSFAGYTQNTQLAANDKTWHDRTVFSI